MIERIDAITKGVVWAALQSIAEEAGQALRKTAYSQAVREGRDFSAALFDARGEMIAQGDFSPGHLGAMPSIVRHVMREYPPGSLGPGDAVILNDLYMGSGHLPDFFLTTPVFHRDRLVGFVVNCAHQVDVGGAAAGSQAVEGITEFYQEGIRILPTRLWRAGEVNREVMRLITGNVRVPGIVEGDLRAMRSSGRVGELRLLELFERYGTETVLATWDEILAHSEAEMRAAIREVPSGRYSAEDFYDDCGRNTDPLRVFATVIVDGDEITVDFDGSSPQTPSGMNSAFNYTLSYTWHTVKSALVQQTIPQMGARPHKDGAEAVCGSFNLENIPVEVNESNYPILIERLELIPDSCGAGKFRGSCGLRKDIRFLGERGSLSNLSDRHRFAAPGLLGGGPGAPGRIVLNPDTTDEQVMHSKAIYPLAHGDLVSLRVSGSGGYGDPLERDPALVARDVMLGYVSAEQARERYGVILDAADVVDVEATVARRVSPRGSTPPNI